MTKFRKGQQVRVEWPDGSVIQGVLGKTNGSSLAFRLPDRKPLYYVTATGAATIVVLSDPRADEPTGLGAVVEDGEGWWWVRAYVVGASSEPWLPQSGHLKAWADLADPLTILSEGWTP